ncbi:hypothetical protein RRG08_049153 [Elysia crispata]|uniref:Uncharacterized protein n=1 Tax=Elysia crispata TaxID=231223 RepID=A0AAE1ARI1_9GAST|nr:hypothetical protein RRG08_049153 [Elysia crispata]
MALSSPRPSHLSQPVSSPNAEDISRDAPHRTSHRTGQQPFGHWLEITDSSDHWDRLVQTRLGDGWSTVPSVHDTVPGLGEADSSTTSTFNLW